MLLPPTRSSDAPLLLATRGLRAFADGFISLVLPFYLTVLGFDAFQVGLVATVTLLGSGSLTLVAGIYAWRFRTSSLLQVAAASMVLAGVAFVALSDFWPLLLVALFGPLNPTSGDVSVFSPLEHSLLAHAVDDSHRTAWFARYNLVGSLMGALGALAAGMPSLLSGALNLSSKGALQAMFVLYALIGVAVCFAYRRLAGAKDRTAEQKAAPLGASRPIVLRLAGVFALDAFGGGFVVQSLLALWLHQRFGLSEAGAGLLFFTTGVLGALSFLAAAPLARRIGLINTMVYTHLPSNLLLALAPFMPDLASALGCLLVRSLLASMDIPTRTSYVMAVVSPGERAAAAAMTAVPRSFASGLSPMLAGYLLGLSTFGWPLIAAGALKTVYDLLLLAMFSQIRPPEERARSSGHAKSQDDPG
jgi:MFS family permease